MINVLPLVEIETRQSAAEQKIEQATRIAITTRNGTRYVLTPDVNGGILISKQSTEVASTLSISPSFSNVIAIK
jgi:hypothetical protein